MHIIDNIIAAELMEENIKSMKTSLSYRLFAGFFLNSVIIIIIFASVGAAFLHRNFIERGKEMDGNFATMIAEKAAEAYDPVSGWEPLRNDPVAWKKLFDPPDFMMEHKGPPPHKRHDMKPDGSHEGKPPFFRDIAAATVLLDEKGAKVAGSGDTANILAEREVIVKGVVKGRIIIDNNFNADNPPTNPVIRDLFESRMQLLGIISLFILIISSLITYYFLQHLLKPVEELANATRLLAKKDFKARINITRKDELGQLGNDFNLMAARLEGYEAARKQWITDIAHELRTPLSVLQGQIEAMQDGIRPINKDSIAALHREVMYLGKVVNHLHELSAADSAGLSLQKEEVMPVIILEEQIANFSGRFEQNSLTLEKDLEEARHVSIMADPYRIKQIFYNIIENSVRYTDIPGKLRITGHIKDGLLEILFEDSEPGVVEELHGRIFDRMFRVDKSRSRMHGGSGLGLAICKTLTESMDGTIRAYTSQLGGLAIELKFKAKA